MKKHALSSILVATLVLFLGVDAEAAEEGPSDSVSTT